MPKSCLKKTKNKKHCIVPVTAYIHRVKITVKKKAQIVKRKVEKEKGRGMKQYGKRQKSLQARKCTVGVL